MSASQRITGLNAKVFFIAAAGGTTDLSGDRKTLDITREVQTTNMEAGNDTSTYEAATIQHNEGKLTVLAKGTAGTALRHAIIPGAQGTLVWGEIGTTAGSPKGGFPCVVKSASPKIPYTDAVELEVMFAGQGALTFDDSTDVW